MMSRFWTFAIIGIVLFINVATCYNKDSVWENTEDLITNFPQYLLDAIEEEQELVNQNISTKSIHIPQCLKDYLHIFEGIARGKMWAVRGMTLFSKAKFIFLRTTIGGGVVMFIIIILFGFNVIL